MLSDRIGVCVVGGGFWARAMHLPAFASIPGVDVVSLVSRSEAGASVLAEAHGVKRWSTDYIEAVTAPDVDVVDIIAPNHLHAPIAVAAAEAGKHIICIKPLATTLAEADRMLEAAAKNNVRLLYAENVPFIPAVQEMRRIVDSGAIGKVFRVKACEGIGEPHSAWHYDPARAGGGAMMDMAVHSVEFCRAFAGAPFASVYADAGTFRWGAKTKAEDTAVMTLRFDNGVIGQCEDSWSLAGAMDSRFEVFGTEGRILIDNLHRQPIQVVSGSGQQAIPPGWSFPSPMPGAVMDGHVAMLTHFIDAIRTGKPSASEGVVGWNALAVIEAATASVKSGKREAIRTRKAG
ncbi:MAG TPA: Gfo/Idh/MocA family oxidoreductase [Bauldia sp.]|nr:Gfo/Idh/MocA family oxidoreductase [Bauldia sp.]